MKITAQVCKEVRENKETKQVDSLEKINRRFEYQLPELRTSMESLYTPQMESPYPPILNEFLSVSTLGYEFF